MTRDVVGGRSLVYEMACNTMDTDQLSLNRFCAAYLQQTTDDEFCFCQ